MAQTALHLADILPDVAYRQFVLTLPYPVRYRAAYDGKVHKSLFRAFVTTLRAWYQRRAREAGVGDPHWGAVTAVQRVGSALQLTPHGHSVACDGCFAVDRRGLYARFHPLLEPTEQEC